MKIRLPKTNKKVIIDDERQTVTTILFGIDNPSLKFVGVAKCSPLDNFNPEVGAKISYKRAKCAMLVQIRNEIRAEVKKGQKYAEIHQELVDDLTKAIEELKQDIYNIVE